MKNIKLLIFFLTIICIVLVVNVISFINGIPGSTYGIYLNMFNIISLFVEIMLFNILNKSSDNSHK